MCGRFTLTVTPQALAEAFGLDTPAPEAYLRPRYNISPTQPVLIVRAAAGRGPGRELALVQWGLIPGWAKDPRLGANLINAKSETVAEKPAFRGPVKYRRCLVPGSGFYEWQRRGQARQPYYYRLREAEVFGLAGLWEHWEGADGSVVESCTVLTTDANELARPVHDRMPVILPPEAYALWLDPTVRDPRRVTPLLRPYPAERMEAIPVSSAVNSAREDRPEFIQRCDPAQSELF
jgi:putative SOS response-associated peptidase YedK